MDQNVFESRDRCKHLRAKQNAERLHGSTRCAGPKDEQSPLVRGSNTDHTKNRTNVSCFVFTNTQEQTKRSTQLN